MGGEDSRTDLGMIRIHKNVIASIAAIAAGEIEGVKRVEGNFKNGIMALLGKSALPSIKVEIDKHEDVRVEIPLIVKYDFNVPDICAKVQENVRNALEKMTNLTIKDINVNVQGIEK